MSKHHFITWDLGGTKCAAGLIEYQSEKNTYTCLKKTTVLLQETQSLEELVIRIQESLQINMQDVEAICIGAAGQYDGHQLILENGYPYDMPFNQLAEKYDWPHFAIIHDYATVLCATFTQYLYSSQFVKRLNHSPIPIFERRLTFGVGTGLGGKDGLLLANGDFWLGTNEIGFLGLPALIDTKPLHTDLLAYLHKQQIDSPIVFETILSGAGLQLLYQFLYPERPHMIPADIGDLMQQGQLYELTDLFAWYLGLFVATLQLAFMPAGGIWLTGGVLLKHPELMQQPSFQAGIHALPAYFMQRSQYPLGVLHHPDWPLIGAAFYANKRLRLKQATEKKSVHLVSVSS